MGSCSLGDGGTGRAGSRDGASPPAEHRLIVAQHGRRRESGKPAVRSAWGMRGDEATGEFDPGPDAQLAVDAM